MPKLAADLAGTAKIRQALLGGFASSRIPEVHGERIIKRPLQPGVAPPAGRSHCNAPKGPGPGAARRTQLGDPAHLGVALPQTAMAQYPVAPEV